MTSNVGATEVSHKTTLGFAGGNTAEYDNMCDRYMDALKAKFRPEFLNRIDDTIVFTRLSEEDIKEIAKRLLKSLEKRMSDIEIGMTFDDSVIDFVSKAGYDKIYGARPLKRAIQTNIEDVLSEKILDKSVEKGKSYICSMDENGGIQVTTI